MATAARRALRALLALALAQLAAAQCLDDSWHFGAGKCWKKITGPEGASRDTLAQICKDLRPAGDSRAYLPALLKNEEERQAALVADGNEGCWIGLKRLEGDATPPNWIWDDGEVATFQKWNEGEPNGAGGNEACVHVDLSDTDRGWNDLDCNTPNKCLVCQLKLTPRPTTNPTTSPTNPTPEPTSSPTRSPTITLNACLETDKEQWESVGSVGGNFDNDHAVCEVLCAYTIGTRSEEVIDCVRDCYADTSSQRDKLLSTEPYSYECSLCFGLFSSCLLRECECFDRGISTLCEECSKDKCESSFLACSGFNSIPAVFKEDDSLDMDIVIIAAAAGGSAVLCMAGVALFALIRRNKKTADALAEMATGPISAPREVKVEQGIRVPAAAAAQPGSTNRESVAERRQVMFEVVHPFTAEEDDELTVTEGAVVQGLREVDSKWWLCYDPESGDEGMVPTVNLRMTLPE